MILHLVHPVFQPPEIILHFLHRLFQLLEIILQLLHCLFQWLENVPKNGDVFSGSWNLHCIYCKVRNYIWEKQIFIALFYLSLVFFLADLFFMQI